MNRLLLACAIVVLSGCAVPTPPPPPVAEPAPSPPRILHKLVLTSHLGKAPRDLKRESGGQVGAETVTDSSSGAIVVTDDVGNWRFAYTKTSLEGPGLAPEEWLIGLHALSVIVTNTSGGDLDIDWERCVFVDPAGRTHRTIHRGVQLNQLTSPMLSSRVAAGAPLHEFSFPPRGVRFPSPTGRTGSVWNSPSAF